MMDPHLAFSFMVRLCKRQFEQGMFPFFQLTLGFLGDLGCEVEVGVQGNFDPSLNHTRATASYPCIRGAG